MVSVRPMWTLTEHHLLSDKPGGERRSGERGESRRKYRGRGNRKNSISKRRENTED